MTLPTPNSSICNQQIRLHQDQAAFISCLSFLELSDIITCLSVCQYWNRALKSSRLGWSGCVYKPHQPPFLSSQYHPFIIEVHLSGSIGYIAPNALESFTHAISIHLEPSLFGRWDIKQQGLETLFGLMHTSPTSAHRSQILSFHLIWKRNPTNVFPLQRVLENPRFASLQELSIRKPGAQPKEAIVAIGGLKELRKLTCHVQLSPMQDDQFLWTPNLVLFEVIHQLPLLHTFSVNDIPEGIAAPLPSTITDLTIRDLPPDGSRLCTALCSLIQLKSFTFYKYFPQVGSNEFLKWLNRVTSFQFVHIHLGGQYDVMVKSKEFVNSFVLNNSSQLAIRLIKCNESAICELELVRDVTPPSATDLPPGLLCPTPSYQSYEPDPSHRHPLHRLNDWPIQSLKELYVLNMPLTPGLMRCLSYLPSISITNQPGLEHLELTVHATESVTTVQKVVTQFCEFLGQQARLRTLVLHGRWIHQYSSQLSGALVHCCQLQQVRLNTHLDFECDGRCTIDLARVLSQLPHLARLHLVGSCLSHRNNLTHLVTSPSLRQLDCVLLGNSGLAAHRIALAKYFLSHPHLQTTMGGQPIRDFALTQPQPSTPSLAANNTKPIPPASSKPSRCLIQ